MALEDKYVFFETTFMTFNIRRMTMTRLLTRMTMLLTLVAGFFGLATVSAHAGGHGGGYIEDGAGYSVAAVEHAYLTALRDNVPDIRALARDVLAGDAEAAALDVYMDQQAPMALWGYAPGGTEANSPFHQPVHAYLATAQQLLTLMQTTAADSPAVTALAAKLQADRARVGADSSLCQYSGTGFNTATPVGPDWDKAPTHLPTLAVLGGLALLLALGTVEGLAYRQRRMARTDTGFAGLAQPA
jgi:hypothetical protein